MGSSELSLLRALAPVMSTVPVPRGRRRLHTMPTSCGYEIRHDEPYDWNGLKRGQTPFTVLQHTVAGVGSLIYERHRYRIEAGDTMLVVVPHNHRYWLEAGGTWEYFWLSTTGQEAVAIQRDILAVAGPVFRLHERTIEHLAGCCRRLIESRAEAPGAISAVAYEALMALYDDLLFRSHDDGNGRASRMGRVVRHIRAHLAQTLDIPSLAALAGLSRTQFTRLFTLQEGLPPAEFVLRERMTEAARALARADTSVAEVARACGFNDPNYFAKVFRRTFGISPTEFRTTGMYSSALRARDVRTKI